MGNQITKSDVRQVVVQLAQLPVPEDIQRDEELYFLLIQHKFDAIDIACAVLQGNGPIDFAHVWKKNLKDVNELLERQFDKTIIKVKVQDFEKRIIDLLKISRDYQSQTENDDVEPSTPLPSFRQLSDVVYVAQGQLEAESIRLFLESFGISARTDQESAGVALGLTVGMLGEAGVRVAPEDIDDARLILQAMLDGLFIFPEVENETDPDLDIED